MIDPTIYTPSEFPAHMTLFDLHTVVVCSHFLPRSMYMYVAFINKYTLSHQPLHQGKNAWDCSLLQKYNFKGIFTARFVLNLDQCGSLTHHERAHSISEVLDHVLSGQAL